MLVTKKMLLALALIGALLGAGVGALATRAGQTTSAASANDQTTQAATTDNRTPEQIAANNSQQFSTTAEQNAYRKGFEEGCSSCSNGINSSRDRAVAYNGAYESNTGVYRTSAASRRVYNHSSGRTYYSSGTRYYSSAPRGRSFWQKHRDKLTVAMGSGAGALIGGLIGGRKGAGIGLLSGGVGSALYTYKLRHRTHRY